MDTIRGILIIKGLFSGSKSDGFKPFLISDQLQIFHLYRAGIYEVNDRYFYPYHKKCVEVTGIIQKDKFVNVHDIKEIPDSFTEQINDSNSTSEE